MSHNAKSEKSFVTPSLGTGSPVSNSEGVLEQELVSKVSSETRLVDSKVSSDSLTAQVEQLSQFVEELRKENHHLRQRAECDAEIIRNLTSALAQPPHPPSTLTSETSAKSTHIQSILDSMKKDELVPLLRDALKGQLSPEVWETTIADLARHLEPKILEQQKLLEAENKMLQESTFRIALDMIKKLGADPELMSIFSRWISKKSYSEIAIDLGMSKGTVGNRMQDISKILRKPLPELKRAALRGEDPDAPDLTKKRKGKSQTWQEDLDSNELYYQDDETAHDDDGWHYDDD